MTASAGHPLRPTTLEIDLDAAAANVRAVRQLVGPARKIFAVVKADGYGHRRRRDGRGVRRPRRRRARGGRSGRGRPAPRARDHRARPRLSELAAGGRAGGARPSPHADPGRSRRRARVLAGRAGPCDMFVKIDVGLERLGVPAEQAVKTITAMLELPHLRLAGLCAHPHAEGHRSGIHRMAARPLHRGRRRAGDAGDRRTHPALRGLALRAALPADVPQRGRSRPDALRHHVPRRDAADAAAAGVRALVTRVIALKELTPRERFAEQAPFPVTAPMRLGVIPMGRPTASPGSTPAACSYAGAPCPSSPGRNLEHTRIDLTSVPDARVGDEVVIIGRQGDRGDHDRRGGQAPRPRPSPRGDHGGTARHARLPFGGRHQPGVSRRELTP